MFNTISSTKGTQRNFKREVGFLVLLLFIEKENHSEWGVPSFTKHKSKTNRVRFLSGFKNVNEQLKRKPSPMPKINEMLLKLEGFQYATPLGLIIGYYHIQLNENVSNLCVIILLWGKYCYKRLTMSVANSVDVFQHKMNDYFHGF